MSNSKIHRPGNRTPVQMTKPGSRTRLLAAAALLFSSAAVVCAPSLSATQEAKSAEKIAKGEFEVKLTPVSASDAPIARMTSEKQFRGDLEGTSKGEMLSVGTAVKGSAGYVAMEQVTGTLAGRTGTFALQHTGTMNRGEPQLTITVVPDSGTGQLAGITGKLAINIISGKHFYEFTYTLPEK